MENSSNDKGLGLPATPSGSSLQVLAEDGSGLSAAIPKPPAHTPGPWMVTDKNTVKADLRSIGLGETAGEYIASVMGGPTSGPRFVENAEEVRANARLIAAAPDMYTALQRIAEHFDQDGYGPDAWKKLALEMAEVAHEALAKATSNS